MAKSRDRIDRYPTVAAAGAAILIFRASTFLQAAPAAWPWCQPAGQRVSMGCSYVNFSVKGDEQNSVADVLGRARRRAIVTPPQSGYVVAYDAEADRQATAPILVVAGLLSRELERPVLAALNHDDDVLCYWLFLGSELVDAYNSHPEAWAESSAEAVGGD